MTVIQVGNRVHGKTGVFYKDKAADGVVLNFVGADCVHVELDDGDKCVVLTSDVEVKE